LFESVDLLGSRWKKGRRYIETVLSLHRETPRFGEKKKIILINLMRCSPARDSIDVPTGINHR